MRIRSKILLVGGIPIVIAAAIAIAALLLLREADRAREGAVLAGTLYRNLLTAVTARDNYFSAPATSRDAHSERFWQVSTVAHANLGDLEQLVTEPRHRKAATDARGALDQFYVRMGDLIDTTRANDRLIAEMTAKADSLIAASREAREREYASNRAILKQLFDTDLELSAARDVVNRATNLRSAVTATEAHRTALAANGSADQRAGISAELARLRTARQTLAEHLQGSGQADEAAMLDRLVIAYRSAVEATTVPAESAIRTAAADLTAWTDRIADRYRRDQLDAQSRLAELVTETARARTAEQSTQDIVLAALQLGDAAEQAIDNRDAAAADAILEESRRVRNSVAALPVAPAVRDTMVQAIDAWESSLAATIDGLRQQSAMIADMDRTAATMIGGARTLNDILAADAEDIGDTIRNILVLGAAFGLLLGAFSGIVVARSIIRPIRQLQQDMVTLAADPAAGKVEGTGRGDELGDMARATDFFVKEIGRREGALIAAKEEADQALLDLKQAQAELVQAEKLASLGQLVAGVAHEINTPLGIAVTTSTLMSEEVKRIEQAVATNQMPRAAFERFLTRMKEGATLLNGNLDRASNLIQSFKQVAADQASDQSRRFEVKAWLTDLLTSLGPVLRKSGHEVVVDCPEGLWIDTYPGALGQVLTNLIINSVTHGFAGMPAGRIEIAAAETDGVFRVAFSDNGKGIRPEHLGKVFDPFFTTGRSAGNTGLGLHIVYNLVTSKLRGRIEVDRKPGEGARFTVEIPADVRADEAAEAAEARRAAE